MELSSVMHLRYGAGSIHRRTLDKQVFHQNENISF